MSNPLVFSIIVLSAVIIAWLAGALKEMCAEAKAEGYQLEQCRVGK